MGDVPKPALSPAPPPLETAATAGRLRRARAAAGATLRRGRLVQQPQRNARALDGVGVTLEVARRRDQRAGLELADLGLEAAEKGEVAGAERQEAPLALGHRDPALGLPRHQHQVEKPRRDQRAQPLPLPAFEADRLHAQRLVQQRQAVHRLALDAQEGRLQRRAGVGIVQAQRARPSIRCSRRRRSFHRRLTRS
ncbi:MAG TPA: hypothetical protein PKD25_04480 [Rubrivivax sp.]|nr:hypothetical protein [Rubrivivax sp.]